MVVDLVFLARVASLIKTVKLVGIDEIAICHQHSMEGDGEAPLAEAGDLLHIAEDEGALRNEHLLAVMTVENFNVLPCATAACFRCQEIAMLQRFDPM